EAAARDTHVSNPVPRASSSASIARRTMPRGFSRARSEIWICSSCSVGKVGVTSDRTSAPDFSSSPAKSTGTEFRENCSGSGYRLSSGTVSTASQTTGLSRSRSTATHPAAFTLESTESSDSSAAEPTAKGSSSITISKHQQITKKLRTEYPQRPSPHPEHETALHPRLETAVHPVPENSAFQSPATAATHRSPSVWFCSGRSPYPATGPASDAPQSAPDDLSPDTHRR